MRISHPLRLVELVIGCELVGIVGGLFTVQSIPAWYAQLNKASFSPQPWVFGPAWLVLYLLMGIAIYLATERGFRHRGTKLASGLFAAQLALNFLWSVIFFGMRSIPGGLVDIIALVAMIAATTVQFYRVRKAAAYLMVPYLAWTIFATALNYYAFALNP